MNGRVGAVADSPWPPTLVNFSVAAVSLAVALAIRVAFRGPRPDACRRSRCSTWPG
nr:hypothetical protein [Amycolatopsis umgeniensis]